jgi:MHS family proline/betaine transporter-like MFS transporter
MVLSYPMLWLTTAYPGFGTVVAVQITFSVLYALYSGAAVPTYVELIPIRDRIVWLAGAHNLSGIIFGAFAGYIATWLIAATGSPLAAVYLVLLATIVSGLGMVGLRETVNEPLR